MEEPLIKIENLHIRFNTLLGAVEAVRGIDLEIKKGRVLGLVGESGSGKSLTGLSIMGLIPKPNGWISEGDIFIEKHSVREMKEQDLYRIRGNKVAMIFQEPMTSLNPVLRIGDQIGEALWIHQRLKGEEQKKQVLQMLDMVKIPSPEKVYYRYPHQLSGGMRQRIMIAMAISCNPDLLIADEPTTALDVTIQAQILRMMKQLVAQLSLSILFITHDLGVISQISDDIAVMYCGKIVEAGKTEDVLSHPLHPYTKGLIEARPDNYTQEKGYHFIPGRVPSLYDLGRGCSFADRCCQCMDICFSKEPAETFPHNGHRVSCWRA
ncbi:MAG: ABC transporter ATP-binding protein [Peptostreptococcaceae bacterium]|nr:ABC transporter ATP-binding protein [Peptostreptococcaceae bacterium]